MSLDRRHGFIVSLSWIDVLTLGSLLLACAGLLAALHGRLTLAIALMLLALLADMLDGALARRTRRESEFGRYLDGFCDVITYLLLPMFVLYQFGMQDPLSLAAFFVFISAGVLRLSRFNMVGVLAQADALYYLGLPVFWSHLVVGLAFPVWRWLGHWARYPIVATLLVMSLYMIRNRRFRKPTRYARLAALILSAAAVYLYLHAAGSLAP